MFLLGEGVVVLKELISNSFYFGRVWWSWKNRIYWFFLDLACRFCMLPVFKEPTMPLKLRLTFLITLRSLHQQATLTQTRGGVTNYADCCWGWLPLEPWGGVTSRQLQCQTLLPDQRRSHQCNSDSYTLYMHLLIFPHRTPKLLSSQCNYTGSWPFSLHACTGWCIITALPDRRHTVKQRGLHLAWSSCKFYP